MEFHLCRSHRKVLGSDKQTEEEAGEKTHPFVADMSATVGVSAFAGGQPDGTVCL